MPTGWMEIWVWQCSTCRSWINWLHEMQTDIERFKYYQAKAALLQESKNYADAIVYYRKIVDMLRSGYKDARDYEHYRKLSECYLAVNNLPLAYNYMTQAYALRDSVFQTEETDQLSEYSVKYRTKEKELEIVSLRREQLEQETYMLRHRIIVGSVISLLGICCWAHFMHANVSGQGCFAGKCSLMKKNVNSWNSRKKLNSA